MSDYTDIPSPLFPLNGEQTRIQRRRLQRRRGWQLAAALAGITLLSSLLGWRLGGSSSAPSTARTEPSPPLAEPILATPSTPSTPPPPVLLSGPLTDPATPAHTLTDLTFSCSSDHLLASATVTNSAGKPLGWAGLRLTLGATTTTLAVPPLTPGQSLPLFFSPTSCSDADFPDLPAPTLTLLFCNPPES